MQHSVRVVAIERFQSVLRHFSAAKLILDLFSPVINCGKPEVPAGSELIGDRFTVNSLVQFKCKAGHKRVEGEGTLVCSSSGQWDGVATVCKCKCRNFWISTISAIWRRFEVISDLKSPTKRFHLNWSDVRNPNPPSNRAHLLRPFDCSKDNKAANESAPILTAINWQIIICLNPKQENSRTLGRTWTKSSEFVEMQEIVCSISACDLWKGWKGLVRSLEKTLSGGSPNAFNKLHEPFAAFAVTADWMLKSIFSSQILICFRCFKERGHLLSSARLSRRALSQKLIIRTRLQHKRQVPRLVFFHQLCGRLAHQTTRT